MGRIGKPAELITKYRGHNIAQACDAFFGLAAFGRPLWYTGNDILALVSDKVDLVRKISAHVTTCLRREAEQVLNELYENVGLSEPEQAMVIDML